MQLRRLNTELLAPCHEDFTLKRLKCEEKADGQQACIEEGVQGYRECVQQRLKVMQRYYNDHIRGFKEIMKLGAESQKGGAK